MEKLRLKEGDIVLHQFIGKDGLPEEYSWYSKVIFVGRDHKDKPIVAFNNQLSPEGVDSSSVYYLEEKDQKGNTATINAEFATDNNKVRRRLTLSEAPEDIKWSYDFSSSKD